MSVYSTVSKLSLAGVYMLGFGLSVAVVAADDTSGARPIHDSLQFDSNSERLLELRLSSGYKIRDVILAFQFDEELYLPLFEIGEALGFALEVVETQRAISGFLWTEEDRFEINLVDCIVSLGEETQSFAFEGKKCSVGRFFEGEVYVHQETLAQWYKSEISFVSLRSQILLSSSTLSPLERNLEEGYLRDLKIAQNSQRSKSEPRSSDGRAETFSNPHFSYETSFQRIQVSGQDYQDSFGIAGATSFVVDEWRNSLLFQGTQEGISRPRYTLSKSGDRERTLAFLSFRQFEAFNIQLPPVEGVLASRSSTGVYLSNRRLGAQFFASETFLDGVTQPGWVVELYQFGILIAAVNADEQGYFAFESVNLASGDNFYKIIARGPQGQTEEFSRSFSVEDTHPGMGKVAYEASLVETDAAVRISYGVTESLFLDSTMLNELDSSNGNRSWGRFTLGTFFQGWSPSVNFVLGEGYFVEPTVRLFFKNSNIDIRYALFESFSSPEVSKINDQFIGHRGSLGSVSYFTFFGVPLTFRQNIEVASYNNTSDKYFAWTNSFFSSVYGVPMQIDYSYSKDSEEDWNLSYKLRKALDGAFWQAGIDLSPADVGLAETWTAEVNKNWSSGFSTRVAYTNQQNANQGRDHLIDVGLAKDMLGHELFWNFSSGVEEWSSQIGLRSTLFVERTKPALHFRPEADVVSATARVKVCKDINFNSACDVGEEGYAGVDISLNNRSQTVTTDEQGHVFLTDLVPNSSYELRVDTTKLFEEDYDLEKYIYSISIDPGRYYVLNIAAAPVAELDGYIECEACPEGKGVANRKIELTNQASGEVVKTYSEFDGYFLFDSLRPGRYSWRSERAGRFFQGSIELTDENRVSTLYIKLK